MLPRSSQDKMTGIVDGTEDKVLFCNDKYEFTFMTSKLLD